MVKRISIWIIFCGLLGASANVLVALVCVIVAEQWPGKVVKFPRQEAAELNDRYFPNARGLLSAPDWGLLEQFGYREFVFDTMIRLPVPNKEWPINQYVRYSEVRAGWPLKSFQGSNTVINDMAVWHRKGLNLPPGPDVPKVTSQESENLFLPTAPVWRGFICNSLFYVSVSAAIIGLFILLSRRIKHLTRTRRNRCPACGYPAGESDVCTECGRPQPAGLRSGSTT